MIKLVLDSFEVCGRTDSSLLFTKGENQGASEGSSKDSIVSMSFSFTSHILVRSYGS